jgi:DNA-binding PadR family transcriptional regulator
MPPTRRSLLQPPLPPLVYLILLALQDGESHGYRIRADVVARSGGTLRLDPGSLYRLIARLLDAGLISESSVDAADEPRRRTYRLTAQGRRVLTAETNRMADLVAQARGRPAKRPRPA